VLASGVVAVKFETKAVQHAEGGILREILVAEGDLVEAGAPVARLDDTQVRAKLGMIEGQLAELLVEQSRLEAERDGATAFAEPAAPHEYAASGIVERAVEGQQRHLDSLREMIAKKKEQMTEQIAQIASGVAGTEAKLQATVQQIGLAEAELAVLQSLMERGLTTRNRIFAMERELAQLRGEAEDLKAKIASHRRQSAEVQIKLLEIDDQRRSQVTARLSEIRPKIADLYEQRGFELFRLQNARVVAPIAGRVHDLRVHSISGVVRAGDTMMIIVPSEERLVFRVRVRPQDIDRLYIGQSARLRLTSLNVKTTPEIEGQVNVVSADQLIDSVTGVSYFRVDIEARADALTNIDSTKIRPGLPVDAFITTDQQTVMTYLIKPLVDQFARAFRES